MTLHIEFPCSHMLPLPARTSRPSPLADFDVLRGEEEKVVSQ
jgi:hypothetical protein